MDGLMVRREARAAGLDIRIDGDRLIVRGPRSAAPIAERLLGMKREIIALLEGQDDEVTWRVGAMRAQLRPGAPIPFLVARRDLSDAPGLCPSCDAALADGRRFRCAPCVSAVERVLNEVREGC